MNYIIDIILFLALLFVAGYFCDDILKQYKQTKSISLSGLLFVLALLSSVVSTILTWIWPLNFYEQYPPGWTRLLFSVQIYINLSFMFLFLASIVVKITEFFRKRYIKIQL